MSLYHCLCGFAADEPDEFGDHLREVFDRGDAAGTDGRTHVEVDGGPDRQGQTVCACGFAADGPAEFDDHVLLALVPEDGIDGGGTRHAPVNPSTPDRWYIRRAPDE